jgi:hypothetical protein
MRIEDEEGLEPNEDRRRAAREGQYATPAVVRRPATTTTTTRRRDEYDCTSGDCRPDEDDVGLPARGQATVCSPWQVIEYVYN